MTADIEAWAHAGLEYVVDGPIVWLRLNRPQKRNAIDVPLRNALLAAIREVSADSTVRAVVVTGNGVAFSSGGDLKQADGIELAAEQRLSGAHGLRANEILYGWWRLLDAIWRSEKPFLAAVNGVAAGVGCQLAFACDLILASEDATFWEAFVRRGLPLEGGGAWILPRLTSLVRAKELAMFGDPLSAADAERWGMINRCVPVADFDETVVSWAQRLANGPTLRIGHIKEQLNSSLESTLAESFRQEATMKALGGGEDFDEAIRAFRERRDPEFTGR